MRIMRSNRVQKNHIIPNAPYNTGAPLFRCVCNNSLYFNLRKKKNKYPMKQTSGHFLWKRDFMHICITIAPKQNKKEKIMCQAEIIKEQFQNSIKNLHCLIKLKTMVNVLRLDCTHIFFNHVYLFLIIKNPFIKIQFQTD